MDKVQIAKKVEGGGNPPWSLGKVLYEVFDIATNDYHNELYAMIQADHERIIDCDKFLIVQHGFTEKQSAFNDVTYHFLSTMIRNHIDYPDNPKTKFTTPELEESIKNPHCK